MPGALIIRGSLLASRDAMANAAMSSAAMSSAASSASAGMGACSSNAGKALQECVANVLDKLSSDVSSVNVPQTRSALHNAASKLRVATGKAQALSAISQCRALISAALRQVRANGGGHVTGWYGKQGGGAGLEAIAGVLGRAAALIQSKG